MTNSSSSSQTPLLKITFKNVGQGDTIITEWKKENTTCLGIIDCRLGPNGENPVVDYLENLTGQFHIQFITLSHPHEDHCAGILHLLNYIHDNGIIVDRFQHTFYFDPSYLNKGPGKQGLLIKKIRTLVANMEATGHLIAGGCINLGSHLKVSAGISFQCLSPSQREFEQYQQQIDYMEPKSLKQGRTLANLLSTVIRIDAGVTSILLTSDAELPVFDRLLTRHKKELKRKFVAAQIPHHGSKENFHNAFWGKLNRSETCPAVISVGENDYKHPDEAVLEKLQKLGYHPHCTNAVNGAKRFYRKTGIPVPKNDAGDLVYEIF